MGLEFTNDLWIGNSVLDWVENVRKRKKMKRNKKTKAVYCLFETSFAFLLVNYDLRK